MRQENKILFIVVICSMIISIILGFSLWNINFWPTDAKVLYFPALEKIPTYQYISQIHDQYDYKVSPWLHGKEMYLLIVSFVQRLMGDMSTLRPLVLVGVISIGFSGILIFLTARKYWGEKIGFLCYVLFSTSCWPYVYILFCKHQPLGLFFFLLAVFTINFIKNDRYDFLWSFLSGLFFGMSIFSSIISLMFGPYYLLSFLFVLKPADFNYKGIVSYLRKVIINGIVVILGCLCVFIFINYPNVIDHIKGYVKYISLSTHSSHFYYNQPVLQQWIKSDIVNSRGGLEWVVKYFFLIMPVVFPAFLVSIIYLLFKSLIQWNKDRWFSFVTIFIIFISMASPIFINLKRIAQYGGNYFTSFIGIILLICYAIHVFIQSNKDNGVKSVRLKVLFVVVGILLFLHIVINGKMFLDDVYKPRMATTFLSEKINELGVKKIYTYRKHPYRTAMVENLSPALKSKIEVVSIDYISDVKDGIILMPPITKDSIYQAVHSDYNKFDKDIFLNELIYKNNLDKYAVASFRTMASSRIWYQEEEIVTYRDLMLGQYPDDNDYMGKVWLLDAKKIYEDRVANTPHEDYINLERNSIRNIGREDGMYIYKGNAGVLKEPSNFEKYITRVYKVGNPTDGLMLYVYELEQEESHYVQVPHKPNNVSKVVDAADISSDADGGLVVFEFDKPLYQRSGLYTIKIYRTGEVDDENYYRIYTKFQQRIGS